MPHLEIKDGCLTISLGWWAGLFWPSRKITVSSDNLRDVYINDKMPSCMLCRKPVANLPGLLCIGTFYPNGYSNKSELWWCTKRHKAFLNLILEHGSHEKIVIGTRCQNAEQLLEKIKAFISNH